MLPCDLLRFPILYADIGISRATVAFKLYAHFSRLGGGGVQALNSRECSASISPARVTRRFAESPLYSRCLLKEYSPVHGLYCTCRLLLGFILDEGVSLDKTCAPVKIQVQIFDVPKLRKSLVDIIFLCFFMDSRHYDHPAFDRASWATVLFLLRQSFNHARLACIAAVRFAAPALDFADRPDRLLFTVVNVHGPLVASHTHFANGGSGRLEQ